MKYRVKVIEKKNGSKSYIPQYCDRFWFFRIVISSILFIVFLPATIWIINDFIKDVILKWRRVIECEYSCYGDAYNAIKCEEEVKQITLKRKKEEELRKKGYKIKDIKYINVDL